MSVLIPPGYVQITLPLTHDGQARSAAIVYGAEVGAGGATPAEVDAHVQSFADNVTMDNEVRIGPAIGTFGQDGGENLTLNGTLAISGTSAAARVPSNVALLVRKSTARGGRRGKGRLYLPWVLEDGSVDDIGQIGSGTVNGKQSEMNDWLAELSGDDRSMVLLHESEGETSPGSPNVVTGLTVVQLVATQRRRLGR